MLRSSSITAIVGIDCTISATLAWAIGIQTKGWRECDVEKIKSGTLDEIYEVLRTRNKLARQLSAIAGALSRIGRACAATPPAEPGPEH
jgi:hypothetical protein